MKPGRAMLFVDTSFWVALRNRRDVHHGEAAELLERHANSTLLTTNHVRGETWTYLRRRAGHAAAVGFLDAIDTSPRIVVQHVDPAAEATAAKWLRARNEREYSFVDATSFAVMKARRLDSALAFDGDFAAVGFIELRP
jgi:predicted nucleic acid-binding protein